MAPSIPSARRTRPSAPRNRPLRQRRRRDRWPAPRVARRLPRPRTGGVRAGAARRGHRELPRTRRPRHPPRLGHERLRAPDLRRPRYQPRARVVGGDEGQARRHHAAVHAPRGRPRRSPRIRGAEIEPLGRAGRVAGLVRRPRGQRLRDPRRRSPRLPSASPTWSVTFGRSGRRAKRAKDDATVGVPNYFGQQRFGSGGPSPTASGARRRTRRLPRGGAAVRRQLLGYGARRHPRRARRPDAAFVRGRGGRYGRRLRPSADGTGDGDWETCLDAIPGKLRFERSMVHRLAERDVAPDAPPDHEDWRHALEAVPSNLQRLFVNAAQSFLFNQVLSEPCAAASSRLTDPSPATWCVSPTATLPRSCTRPTRTGSNGSTRTELPSSPATASAVGRSSPPPIGTETDLGDGEPGEIEREVLADAGIEPGDFARSPATLTRRVLGGRSCSKRPQRDVRRRRSTVRVRASADRTRRCSSGSSRRAARSTSERRAPQIDPRSCIIERSYRAKPPRYCAPFRAVLCGSRQSAP